MRIKVCHLAAILDGQCHAVGMRVLAEDGEGLFKGKYRGAQGLGRETILVGGQSRCGAGYGDLPVPKELYLRAGDSSERYCLLAVGGVDVAFALKKREGKINNHAQPTTLNMTDSEQSERFLLYTQIKASTILIVCTVCTITINWAAPSALSELHQVRYRKCTRCHFNRCFCSRPAVRPYVNQREPKLTRVRSTLIATLVIVDQR
jgi:hypothetical protein